MNDTTGWIKIHRSITEHWLWSEPIKLFWWLDMLMLAKWSDEKNLVGNTLVEVKRGQLLASQSFLSQRWHVHKDTVRTFLHLLQNDEMIEQTTYPKYNLITICNYDKYQADANQTSDPFYDPNTNPNANPNSEPNIEEYKNIRNKENNNTPLTPQGGEQGSLFPDEEEPQKSETKTKKLKKPTVEEVTEYCRKIEFQIDAEDFIDYYDSVGWVVGKTAKPMKDWKAAVRTWKRNRQKNTRINQTNDTDVYEYDSNGNKIKKQDWQ